MLYVWNRGAGGGGIFRGTKVNKVDLTSDDFREAQELKQERIREEEEKRRAAEGKEGEGEAEGADS